VFLTRGSSRQIPDFARVYPQVAIYDRTEAAELSKLVPPAAMAQDWARIVNNIKLHAKYVSDRQEMTAYPNTIAGHLL
jgi:hypothetical protein